MKTYTKEEVNQLMINLIDELDAQGILDNANDAKDEAIKVINVILNN